MKSTLFLTVGDAIAAILLIPVLGYAFFMIGYATEPMHKQIQAQTRIYSSLSEYQEFVSTNNKTINNQRRD